MSELSNIEKIAIAKAIKGVTAESKNLEVGEYAVNMDVHIEGVIKRGADYEQEIVEKAEPWSLLAIALSKLNNVTIESLVREAQSDNPEVAEIKEKANAAIAEIKGKTKTACNGKITVKLTAEKVS